MQEFEFPFERFKRIEESKEEEKKTEELPKIEEVIEEVNEEKEIKTKSNPDGLIKKLTKEPKKLNFNDLEEGDGGVSNQENGYRKLLKGFVMANVHFHFLAEPDLSKLNTKSKFRGLFDVSVLSLFSAGYMRNKDFSTLFKDNAPVHVETADFVIALKKENRVEYRKKLIEAAKSNNWTLTSPGPFKNHMLFQVDNPNYGKEPAKDEDED